MHTENYILFYLVQRFSGTFSCQTKYYCAVFYSSLLLAVKYNDYAKDFEVFASPPQFLDDYSSNIINLQIILRLQLNKIASVYGN